MKSIKHHAKHVYHVTPRFIHGMVAGAFVGVIVVTSLSAVTRAHALSISSARDCDSNAVINCGALTTDDLQNNYNNAGVADIYTYFRISAADVQSVATTAVAGSVTKSGTVTIGSTIVATNALTAGRQNIAGSNQVTLGSTTFYTRPPSVSFRQTSLPAFVVMQNGLFKYAVIGACGNPVMATAIPKPTPAATPKPTPHPTQPSPQTNTPVSPSTPQTPPVVTLASSPAPDALPNTGPGAVIIIALLSIIGGYVFHIRHKHSQIKKHSKRVVAKPR